MAIIKGITNCLDKLPSSYEAMFKLRKIRKMQLYGDAICKQ